VSSSVFVLGAFLVAAGWETGRPWRPVPAFSPARWAGSIAFMLLATGVNFLIAPVVTLFALAGIGGGLPLWVQLAIGVPALDALSYLMHRAFHASPILWRLHALHHSDPELDVSTTVRHHPGEALVMTLAVGVLGAASGLSPYLVGLYAALNLAVQFFAHANIGLPTTVANTLGWVVVTPVMHRVHHSRHSADVASNYGLVFSVWDRLFSTYRRTPEFGEDGIEFGVDRLREQYYQRFDRMLWLPFVVRWNR
jgi:sterol desaturase/sphingolipid hydroxylase (fatty acid hydroxylase superfamily)